MTRLYHFGMRHADGHVEKLDGTVVPTPTEEDFFQCAGLPCLPPAQRDSAEARVPVEYPEAP